jgi:hypothetical protein
MVHFLWPLLTEDLFELPAQSGIDATGIQAVELTFTQFAELHGVAPVTQIGARDREGETLEAIAQGRVNNSVGRRLKCIDAVQPVLTGPTRREGSTPTPFGRIDQSRTATKRRCQYLAASSELGGLPIEVGQKIKILGAAGRDVGLEGPGVGQAQRALDIESLIALLTDRAQDCNASGRGLNRLVKEIDEETVDIKLSPAVHRIGFDSRYEAALCFGLEQAATFGLGFGIRTKVDLSRLESIADARMQTHPVDRSIGGLPCFPQCSQRAAEAINVLSSWSARRDACPVDARFVASFMRRVPAKTSKDAGVGSQVVPALCVGAEELAVVDKIDGSLGVDGFNVRRLADAVEQ